MKQNGYENEICHFYLIEEEVKIRLNAELRARFDRDIKEILQEQETQDAIQGLVQKILGEYIDKEVQKALQESFQKIDEIAQEAVKKKEEEIRILQEENNRLKYLSGKKNDEPQ